MGIATLNIFSTLDLTNAWQVILFSTVFTLWYVQVHVGALDCYNKAFNIESSVYEVLSLGTALRVPDVDPNDWHIWFGGHFNDSGVQYQNHIIENIITL